MITLLRADAENFMGFYGKHNFPLDLDPGLYYWTGKNLDNPRMGANACGKSTILHLIYWVFTGDMLDLAKPADEVVPWKAKTRKSKGKVWFEIDEQYYGLERARAPNSLLLTEGQGGTPRQVDQAEIRQLLGLSNESLKRTIILGQFSELFLDLAPKEQSQFFSEVLELDLWLQAAKEASASRTDHEVKRQSLISTSARLEGNIQSTEEQIDRIDDDITNWKADHDRRIEVAQQTLDANNVTLRKDASALSGATKPEALGADIEDLRLRVARNRKTLEGIRPKQATALRKKTAFETLRTRQEADLDRLFKSKKESVCSECGQQVEPKHITDKIRVLEGEVAETKREYGSSSGELEAFNHLITSHEDEVMSCEAELAPKLRMHEESIKSYAQLESYFRESKQAVQRDSDNLARLRSETNPHVGTKHRLKEYLTTLDVSYKAAEKDITACTKDVEANELLETYFKEIRLGLIDEVLLELEVTIGAYAEQLGLIGWRIKFDTERELKSGGTSVGFTTMLFPPEAPHKPINWKVYSGGERQRWQLAVTFGLSEVLLARAGLESNVEFLDEPSSGMSVEGLEDLLEHLAQRARQYHKAIIVVDHHIFDRGLFDHTMVVVRENGESRLEAA